MGHAGPHGSGAPSPAPQRFIVLFTGSTGSTYLTQLLRHHPDVEMRAEALARIPTAEQQHDFLAKLFATEGARAIGLKAKLSQIRDPDALLGVIHDWDVRVFHLGRANRVKQAVSFLRARELAARSGEVGKSRANLRRSELALHPELDLGATTIDPDELIEVVDLVNTAEETMASYLSRCGDVVELLYEDLLADPSGFFDAFCASIGVAPVELAEADVIKKTSDDLADAITNFDECRAALAGTPFEAMLVEGSRHAAQEDSRRP